MMMMGMGSVWMLSLYMLLMLALVLGFAYIIWVMASKETGNTKLIGQIISIVVIVLSVILCLYGGIKGNKMRHGWKGQGMMMQQGMQGGMEKMAPEMQKMMMKQHREMKK